jgi:hypothetical protein
MPADGPASTHGTPVAPSAAKAARLRCPIAIFPPQISSPATPQTRTPHFPQPRIVLTGAVSPGGACAGGLGAPAARYCQARQSVR